MNGALYMNKSKRTQAFLLIAAVAMLFLFSAGMQGQTVQAKQEANQVDVVFTHDTHSHLNSFSTVVDGKSQVLGGFAKIKTIIDSQREQNPDTLVLDGGDFSMGTLVQTVYETEAAELRMLGEIGCEVTTLTSPLAYAELVDRLTFLLDTNQKESFDV